MPAMTTDHFKFMRAIMAGKKPIIMSSDKSMREGMFTFPKWRTHWNVSFLHEMKDAGVLDAEFKPTQKGETWYLVNKVLR